MIEFMDFFEKQYHFIEKGEYTAINNTGSFDYFEMKDIALIYILRHSFINQLD